MPQPIAMTQHEISRRDALRTGAAMLGLGWSQTMVPAADPPRVDPFHDPVYNLIQPRADLVKQLSDEAQSAQGQPRIINRVPVTGLPKSLPELDDAITSIIKKTGTPGAGLCLAKHGQLVCARGYGRARVVGRVVVEPTMTFCPLRIWVNSTTALAIGGSLAFGTPALLRSWYT